MIYPRQALDDLASIDSDVCIIGGGPAGISIALRLRGQPIKVVLLEGGALAATPFDQGLYAGEIVGHPYYPLESARLRFLGGSSNHWNGKCGPLTSRDLLARPGVPHTGWPLRLEELLPYYQDAQALCGLGPYSLYDDRRALGLEPEPPIGIADTKLAYRVFQKSYQQHGPGEPEEPTRFGRAYREELGAAENVHVYLGANATELVLDEGGTAIERVKLRTRSGATLTARGGHFVLACGGIENARLLLASRSRRGAGIGNENDLVGRFFMDHLYLPDAARLATRLSPGRFDFMGWRMRAGRPVRIDLGLRDDYVWENGLAKTSVRRGSQQPPDPSADAVVEALPDLDSPSGKGGSPLVFRLHASMEQLPDPASRVSLGAQRDALGVPRAKLDWRIGEKQFRDLLRTLKTIGAELRRARIGALQVAVANAEDFQRRVVGQWHHMGTTRMADDPKQGVVDAHCRVHGVANLHVAGSSVFPSCGESNPTLTLCALATRLADRLRSQLTRSAGRGARSG